MNIFAKVLEAAVKNCGPPIHNIVGKFRFLNEFIKMVSPKYFTGTVEEVRTMILALIQQWNFNLPDQPKIHEAYTMLKQQGITFPPHNTLEYINVPVGEAVRGREWDREGRREKERKRERERERERNRERECV